MSRIQPNTVPDRVLALFNSFEVLSVQQIAQGLGITPEYASVAISNLVRSGHLTRHDYHRATTCRYEYRRAS